MKKRLKSLKELFKFKKENRLKHFKRDKTKVKRLEYKYI